MLSSKAFRDPEHVGKLKERIARLSRSPLKIMEFCGTHTHAICKFGIRELLPETIQMFSGPGCPVCVTDQADMDYAIALAKVPQSIIATFGDLLKVPGSYSSLQTARAEGATVQVVYSPLDALDFALKNPHRPVIFLGVGFETTAPTVAAAVLEAARQGLKNFFVYSMHKLTPPAMRAIIDAGEISLSGILCPGHVSTVIGSRVWDFLAQKYDIPAAVAGFEPIDVLWAIEEIVVQHESRHARIVNTYPRSVTPEGNTAAQAVMKQVFESGPARWRGLDVIPESGLAFRTEYQNFDAKRMFQVDPGKTILPEGCHCGEVIRGVMRPNECQLFGQTCSPMRPVGPCMVSAEGSCAAYYQYG
jgi:hydrogenase expression/formation protein HypD